MAVLVTAVVLMAVMGSAVSAFASYITIGYADDYLRWTSDYDWYGINLSWGTRYCVSVSVPWSSDFEVRVYYDANRDGYASPSELIASGTRGRGLDENVCFTAWHTGRYHIKVYSYSGRGSYTVKVKRSH